MKLVILSRFCNGRVRHWAVMQNDTVLFKSDHKERDLHVYTIRGNWALQQGLMKVGKYGYTDQITKPAEEVFCRCHYEYVYNLASLPSDMITRKGKDRLAAADKKIAALRAAAA